MIEDIEKKLENTAEPEPENDYASEFECASPTSSTSSSITSSTSSSSTSSTASDSSPTETVLVAKLLQEVQQLRRDNRQLCAQIEAERSAKNELEVAKDALTAEIEELTKNLFEEANGMVAVEAQARWTLEQTQDRLEAELKKTQELLEMERDQTRMLKSIVEKEKESKKFNDPVLWDVDVFGARITGSYYDDFFPERSFDSRAKESVSHWEALSTRTAESAQFLQFSNFIDECFRLSVKGVANLSDDAILAILGHPFMRNCLQNDIEPCLTFPVPEKSGKLKSMLKKLLPAMLKNTCTIEPLPNCNNNQSTPLPSPESIRASPLSIRSFISIAPPLLRSKTSSPVKSNPIAIIQSQTQPQTSNDLVFGSSPASITSIESCPVSPTAAASSVIRSKCALCDTSSTTHRFRITSSISASSSLSQWNPICKGCRDRLVSVATLFTALRHLLQGLHAHRPKLDVFFDFMQAKRYMFYTRVGVDQSFYALSDFEAFFKKICEE